MDGTKIGTQPTTPVVSRQIEEQQMGLLLGRVLRVGVLASGAAIIVGLVLTLIGGHGTPGTLDEALGKGPNATIEALRPGDIIRGIGDGRAPAWIQLGILLLILTPTLRVALTMVLFFRQHDRALAGLACFVLIILLLGLVGIGA